MNVTVKHNNVDITNSVLSYERVHKICTCIGILTVEIEGTSSRTFEPWDNIDIYEEGDYKNRYYISNVTRDQPSGKITLDCQDNSKRLVDYFIPDQYTVEEPTYTRYWLERFLDEAGITYQFTTTSNGQLLSNFTALGLTQAYDQIMQLLQLSGWYMYFDGVGKAIIGSLDKELTPVDATLDRTDILEITLTKDDKMLRNRAVVWGNYDPFRQERVIADVRVKTRWNYDARDYRTMVVSNSNIPNVSSAYGIANALIKEFARITIEKRLSVHGARNLYVGDTVRVRSKVYTGLGLVTSFGTSMSRAGLVTNLILDERCPRLFGFFNFGDYVYVGTYGDGIWRKHIKFDPTWYDFSDGLDDLAVTDLHINNNIFSSVTSSGGMFYTLADDEPWTRNIVPSLNSIFSGGQVASYSGLMGRATIVDKEQNRILYGVDTYSGLNLGDYYMMYSSYFGTTLSGVLAMSGIQENLRGWVVEYNLASGMNVYNSYPINVSGNYSAFVLDIENDGKNDYVSIGLIGSGVEVIPSGVLGYDYGFHASDQPGGTDFYTSGNDTNSRVGIELLKNFEGDTTTLSTGLSSKNFIAVFDDEASGDKEIVYIDGGPKIKVQRVSGSLSVSTITSPTVSGIGTILKVNKLDNDHYRIFGLTSSADASSRTYSIIYKDWNLLTASIGSSVICSTVVIPKNTAKESASTVKTLPQNVILSNKIGFFFTYLGTGIASDVGNWIKIYKMEVETPSGSEIQSGLIFEADFTDYQPFPGDAWRTTLLSADSPIPVLFANGNDPAYAVFLNESQNVFPSPTDTLKNWLVSSQDGTSFSITKIQETLGTSDTSFIYGSSSSTSCFKQLTNDRFVVYQRGPNGAVVIYNGLSVTLAQGWSSDPPQLVESNIYPIFGTFDNYYVTKDGSTFYYTNPATMEYSQIVTPPTGYTLIHPYSTSDSASIIYYWKAQNTDTGLIEILRSTGGAFLPTPIITSLVSLGLDEGFVAGSFFVNYSEVFCIRGNVPPTSTGIRFLVLQRENTDFNIIQEASFPIRIDISNYSPLLTVQTKEASFRGYLVNDSEVTEYAIESTLSGLINDVQDYRYTYLPGSGLLGITKRGLYVEDQLIHSFDADTLASGVDVLYDLSTTISGSLNRIETTNYTYSGQYLFVTTSGEYPQFWQKDAEYEFFTLYSGLPMSRATIIRVDDRV